MLQGVIRRKIEGLVASASSSAWSVVSGRCRSGGPVRSWSSTCRATTTNRAGPTRPPWQPGSRRSARPVSAMAIVVSTCCCGARLSEDDPGRSGFRVRQPRPRPVGLCQGRHARLLPPGEANGSCLHRSVQRRFRSECLNTRWFPTFADATEPKVREANRSRLGSDIITRIGRMGSSATSPDPAAESRRSTQTTAVIEGRKLQPPALQQIVSDRHVHPKRNARSALGHHRQRATRP